MILAKNNTGNGTNRFIYLCCGTNLRCDLGTLFKQPRKRSDPLRVRQSPAEGNPPAVLDSPRRRQDVPYERLGRPQATGTPQGNALP